MGLQNHNNMTLVLSTDAKPRLKWTPELHQRFVEAVMQLGGAEKATPKSLMRVMGIPGLTLYHLKSHLQKYRLGKSQQSEPRIDNRQEETKEIKGESIDDEHQNIEIRDRSDFQINENMQIAEALQMQMEVQRKLHEQIEVQKHLQLRIEAQGKYLQSVLRKAQETLARYSNSSVGIEAAKAELSRLVLMVSSGCHGSPFSELTEMGSPSPNNDVTKQWKGLCSVESSLTSSESSGRKDEKLKSSEYSETQMSSPTSIELRLGNIQHEEEPLDRKTRTAIGRKRCVDASSVENFVEQPGIARSPQKSGNNKMRKCGLPVTIDLNSICQSDFDSAPKAIDLNFQGK